RWSTLTECSPLGPDMRARASARGITRLRSGWLMLAPSGGPTPLAPRSAALLRPRRLRPRALFRFLSEELRDALDQLHRDGLGEREADRALRDLVRCQVVLVRRDQTSGRGIEREVLLPAREIHHVAAGPLE